jgi:hypothetical protein
VTLVTPMNVLQSPDLTTLRECREDFHATSREISSILSLTGESVKGLQLCSSLLHPWSHL